MSHQGVITSFSRPLILPIVPIELVAVSAVSFHHVITPSPSLDNHATFSDPLMPAASVTTILGDRPYHCSQSFLKHAKKTQNHPKPLVELYQLGVLCPLACYLGRVEMLNILDNMVLKIQERVGEHYLQNIDAHLLSLTISKYLLGFCQNDAVPYWPWL